MPTQPSEMAVVLAEQLIAEGFENVSPVLVQRWRERGLLGAWQHSHAGGPGSMTVPANGAYGRARLLARLNESDRNAVTMSLLAYLTGLPVDAAEIRLALKTLFAEALAALDLCLDGEPIDKADEFVRGLITRRKSRDQIRTLSVNLNGERDPQWQPDVVSRTLEQRTADVLTALLAAAGGDPSWVAVVLPDALRLQGMGEVVVAAELDDPTILAESAEAFEATLGMLFGALGRLDALSDDDVRIASETSVAWVGASVIAELAIPTDPIMKPAAVVPLVVGPLLSQLAMPGQLHAQIMEHRASPDSNRH